MSNTLPRIRSVRPAGSSSLHVTWVKGSKDSIELAGWIATGGHVLAALQTPAIFKTARVGDFGASVEWDEAGDLAIDAVHLASIADEQRALDPSELSAWQSANDFSNEEAAALLGVSRSTWAAYKAGSASVPPTVVMTVRATRRDPILIHAHYRPSKGKAGRPPKSAASLR